MSEIIDVAVIGGGPAGLSAAINIHARGRRATIFSGNYQESGLYKAERLDNYLGASGATGADFLEQGHRQVGKHGVPLIEGRILSIMPMEGALFISRGADVYSARAVILASGIVIQAAYPGEKELLGRGVSYCATCDGMLYKGKKVAVVAKNEEAESDANFLNGIGCTVTVIDGGADLSGLNTDIEVIKERKLEIQGDGAVEGITVGGTAIACQGVFILRKSIAMSTLLPGVELEDDHIKVGKAMETSIPGVFAAGDCAGRPYQVAKAVGEGQIAALSAVQYLDNLEKMEEPAG